MRLVVATVALGLVLGWLRGGRLAALSGVPLRAVRLLWLALLAHGLLALGAAGAASAGARVLLAAGHASVLAFVWINRRLPGMALIAMGTAANGAVMAANGAMPVSQRALRAVAGAPPAPSGRHVLAEDLAGGGELLWLSDVLAVPPLGIVVSAGDLLLAVGVAVLLPALMCRHGRPVVRRQPPVARD